MIDQNFRTFAAQLEQLVAGEPFELTVLIGAEKISSNDPPPKVIFVLDPNEKITDQKGFGGGGAFGLPMPKILFTRVVSFDVHIRGKDREQVEQLINAVTNASYIPAWGSYRPISGEWQPEKDANSYGRYYVLRAEMWIPITRPLQSVRTGMQFPITVPDPMEVTS